MINCDLTLSEARDCGKRLFDEGLADNFKGYLSSIADRNLLERRNHARLRGLLLQDIRSKTPFSLIRFGDGEGNVLFWARRLKDYPDLAIYCMNRIWCIMFGKGIHEDIHLDEVSSGMILAGLNAKYLGVPTESQFVSALERLLHDSRVDLRGMTGVVGVIDWLINFSKPSKSQGLLVNCHIHLSILNFYEELIKVANNISLITCHSNLIDVLHEKFNVVQGELFLIPPQAANIQGAPLEEHYPKRYREITCQLASQSRAGQLFFVGAGLLGKLYCETIREAGGMAIDVGSLMDVWVGRGVRNYHSAEFLLKNKII